MEIDGVCEGLIVIGNGKFYGRAGSLGGITVWSRNRL